MIRGGQQWNGYNVFYYELHVFLFIITGVLWLIV